MPDVACLETGVHGATDPSTVPVVPHSVPAVTLAPHQWWSSAIGIAATERLTRMAYTLKKPTKPSMATTCRLPHPGDSIVMRSSDRSFRNLHVTAGCSTCHSRPPRRPISTCVFDAPPLHNHCTPRHTHNTTKQVSSQLGRRGALANSTHIAAKNSFASRASRGDHADWECPRGCCHNACSEWWPTLAIARPLGFDVFCSVLFALTPPNKSEVPRRAEGSLGPRGLCCSHSLRRRAL